MAQRSITGGSVYSIHEAYTVDKNRKPVKDQEDSRLKILRNQQKAALSTSKQKEAAVIIQKTEESEDPNEMQKWWLKKKQLKNETHLEKLEKEVAKRWEKDRKAKEARDNRKMNGRSRDQSIQDAIYSNRVI